MNDNQFHKTCRCNVLVILLLMLSAQITSAQPSIDKPLPDLEKAVNKNCASTAKGAFSSFPSMKIGHIFLLMEAKDFAQKNLKDFFTCLSGQYPNLALLTVTALSERKELDSQIDLFINPPASDGFQSGETGKTKLPNYYRAYYERWSVVGEDVREEFRYNPDPTNRKEVTYKFSEPTIIKPIYSGNVNADLVVAVLKADINKVKSLLAEGADVNYRDESGDTVLMDAVHLNQPLELILLLLDEGADVNAKNTNKNYFKEEESALIYAAGNPHSASIIKLLLERGANVNIQDGKGRTALMRQAFWGGLEEVKLLLSKGADVNIKDKNGRTALEIALERGKNEVADLLSEAKVKSKAN
jgi:hypothetical protein